MPRTARIAAGVLGTALALTACTAPSEPPGDDGSWSDEPTDGQLAALAQAPAHEAEQFYFVMTDRFADGDPSNNTGASRIDGSAGAAEGDALTTGYDPTQRMFYQGGDLAGVEQRLDYIEGLGTTAIWLTPVVVNQPVQVSESWTGAGYHGYWGTDFTAVDPHLGDDEELQSLIDAAHDRGIAIYLDIVVNHTADVIEYAEGATAYVSKQDSPYTDVDGRPFEDANYAESGEFPEVDATASAYTPVLEAGEEHLKSPDWLNDPAMYHNRGDSTYTGESSTYGDFAGLDDLWTERPEVVDGWIDVYADWIADSGVDGFRIDTVKHVNLEFWPQFLAGVREAADAKGIDFFAFGEVYSGDPAYTSTFVRQADFDAVLDFGFHGAATGFATGSAGAQGLDTLYDSDPLFTTAGTDALAMPTFVSNHDIGRVGRAIAETTAEDTWTDRAILAHQLMFLTRGQPVVYYGDEQGFTGSGGDDFARQTLFASEVADYLDDPIIGSEATHAEDHYDTDHPIYRAIAELGQLRADHPALANGAQVTRSTEDGVFAFSRFETGEGVEYLVAVSNAETAQTVDVETYSDTFTPIYGDGAIEAAGGAASITVPPLSAVVFRADDTVATGDAPGIELHVAAESATVAHVDAEVTGDPLARVAFAVAVDGGDWTYAGTSPGPDHRIAYDLDGLPAGAAVAFKAVAVDRDGRTASAKTETAVAAPDQAGASLTWANVHYDGDPEQWGLYAWGDVAEESLTEWPESIPFAGEDAYGSFASVRLADDASSVGYLVIDAEGNKDHESDRTFDPGATPEIWLSAGSGDVAHSLAEANGYVTVRAPAGGPAWGLHLWGEALPEGAATDWDAPLSPDGTDDWGLYWHVPVADVDADLGIIVHSGDTKLHDGDLLFKPSRLGETWVTAAGAHASEAAADGKAVLHYQRPDGDLDGWTLHTWEGAADPTDWNAGLEPVRADRYGLVFEVDLAEDAQALSYILHRGDEKDLPTDQRLDLAEHGHEVWLTAATEGYVRPAGASTGRGQDLDLAKEQAIWLDADTVALDVAATDGKTFALLSSADGSIRVEDGAIAGNFETIGLTPAGGLTEAQRKANPQYWNYKAFKVNGDADAREALRGQLVATETDHAGTVWHATGVQTAGAVDAVYAAALNSDLGVTWKGGKPAVSLWAPTARSVSLELFDSPDDTSPSAHEMDFSERTGVWTVKGAQDWDRKYYRFAVEVWHPASQTLETYAVTDPYSLSLAADSTHSQIVDLDDADLKPDGWDAEAAPAEVDPAAAQVWEVHVRDFSIADASIEEPLRGTYAAFTQGDSVSVRHLADLAEAGLTHVHLLPTFDIASIPETDQATVDCDLDAMAPDSAEQQACVGEIRVDDAYNWGYDPLHFNTPEGSYATEADGAQRILEYREMVAALHGLGLRVVNDVVYNHTAAAGTDEKSVLDRIVPGYYHRLDPDGEVYNSTCCANTATERPMFDKFIVESTVLWQDAYHVDGFRFDLMGHHPKSNLLAVQSALDDDLLLYGEGWDFGEVAGDALFEQASQVNMAGTGIGTFNDRMRDAVRGGGPFDEDPTTQGYGSGLWTGDNDGDATDEELAALLHAQDLTKLGLVGNLAAYAFTASDGTETSGADLDYNGAGAGYAAEPGDAVNYVDAHDNEILFDALAYKLDPGVTSTERAQMQVLSLATAVLSQGTGFVTAGSELLRSKSLDRDSYDSGDWFNAIRWDCTGTEGFGPSSNGFGAGLPPQWTSEEKWPYAEAAIGAVDRPSCEDIALAEARYLELLQIASSTCAFSLGDAEAVAERVAFPLSGAEAPGVIVMRIDLAGLDDAFDAVTVVFNASPDAVESTVPEAAGSGAGLHPVLEDSADPAFAEAAFDDASGTFTVPGRTVAVFVS